jgi:hypothetical protein
VAFRRGRADPFEFFLAGELSMTVAELRVRMSSAEYAQWVGYYDWRAEREKRELDRQQRQAQR